MLAAFGELIVLIVPLCTVSFALEPAFAACTLSWDEPVLWNQFPGAGMACINTIGSPFLTCIELESLTRGDLAGFENFCCLIRIRVWGRKAWVLEGTRFDLAT